ncbi:tripartite tricarboxylate transporter TctB family protein [Marinimicrococcus flavescens]|uniref:Tripartite tricarboxylate transporter TctB family protein n=1 Tax=Marinimicrococcus flavescens TaxID=3031815 RepID=A0AAP3UXQ3_9PROT|nr:tripartite tricarboxylate transporter TctB family protein [Marinimicrococcus flavescens]
MRRDRLDLIFGAAMLVLAGLLWREAGALDAGNTGFFGFGFDPGFFPRILLGFWAALSLVVLLRGLRGSALRVQAPSWPQLASLMALTAGYVLSITLIGFAFASVAFLLILLPVLGYRRPLVVLPVAVIFPLLTWYVFVFILQIILPVSPWFDRI